MNATVLHYTHPKLISRELAEVCYEVLTQNCVFDVHSVASAPDEPRTVQNMYKTILRGLEGIQTKYVFLAEHDVLYPTYHFGHRLKSAQYSIHVYTMDAERAWVANRKILAGFSGEVEALGAALEQRVARIDAGHKFKWSEIFRETRDTYVSAAPLVDIRHGKNLTGARRPAGAERYPYGWDRKLINRVRKAMEAGNAQEQL